MVNELLREFSEWLDSSGHAIQVDPKGATHEELAQQFLDEFAETPVVNRVMERCSIQPVFDKR
jgi:hypothetical protein